MTSRIKDMFCKKLKDFSQDMQFILKDEKDAITALNSLDALIGISPDIVIVFFHNQITVPYEKMILARDEKFLNNEINNKLDESSDKLTGPLENIKDKINKKWKDLKTKDKNIIWDYFKLLVVLSKRMPAV